MNRTKGTSGTTAMHRRTSRRPPSPLATLLSTVALLSFLIAPSVEASVVHTYRQTSSQLGQKVTSSTLNWESYSPTDMKQLEFAIQGGKYISEDEHYPIYVCRVTLEGVQTSGHTEKQKQAHLCVVSYLKEVKKYERFDVLVNKGHLGKIMWKPWRKFNAGIPLGAISVDDYTYIARRRINHQSIADHMGADYTLGRFDPTVGLGKILVVEEQREREYDDGEVLVETEPFRYELRGIVMDRLRTDVRINTTELASGILENKYDTTNHIETVLSYSYDHTQYWGTHEGIARGLSTKVYEKDSSEPTEINWGLKYSEKRYETKSVSASLQPGTAINVTIMGDYVTLEAPYVAKLFAFYFGSKESVSRNISAEVRKNYLKGIKLDYSPVYWIENGTFVPTTTTTTTSTTTHATTTLGNSELKPIDEPPLVYIADIGRSAGSSDSKSSGSQKDAGDDINDNMIPNESRENYAENLKHMKGAANPGASHSTRLYCWTNSILILLISLTVRVFG